MNIVQAARGPSTWPKDKRKNADIMMFLQYKIYIKKNKFKLKHSKRA
jgi:hypothetical protein